MSARTIAAHESKKRLSLHHKKLFEKYHASKAANDKKEKRRKRKQTKTTKKVTNKISRN